MPLIKWEPFLPDWDRFFDLDVPKGFKEVGQFVPRMDMYEEKGNLVVEMEVPSIKPEDVEVTIEEGHLLVSGKTEKRTEVKEDKYYRKEISSGSFSRTIGLPKNVVADKAEAEYRDGVLKVIIPQQASQGKKVTKKITVKKKIVKKDQKKKNK